MVYYSNYAGNGGINTTNNYNYSTVVTMLPKKTQWPNVIVEYGDYAARLLNRDDLYYGCDVTLGVSTDRVDAKCEFILENTGYKVNDTTIARTGMWLEHDTVNNKYYRIMSTTLETVEAANTSNNVARPVIEVPLDSIDQEPLPKVTATFDSLGGSFESNPSTSLLFVELSKGGVILDLPVAVKDNSEFAGWYTDTNYTTQVTKPIIVSTDKIYYAKWSDLGKAAKVGNKYYDTLQAAVNAVEQQGEPTVVKLFKDIGEKITINNGRKVVLDLNGYTVSNGENYLNVLIVNNGSLEVYNGTIYTNASTNGMINVNSNGTLKIHDLTLTVEGGRQAIYNDGGTTYIQEGTIITDSASARAAVHNKSNGKMNILSGSITSTGAYAVYNETGTLIIGT